MNGVRFNASGLRRLISLGVLLSGVGIILLCFYPFVAPGQDLPGLPSQLNGGRPGNDNQTAWLVFPLFLSLGLVVALVLAWAGFRGVQACKETDLWSHRQRTTQRACAAGAGLSVLSALTAGNSWTGMPITALPVGVFLLVIYSAISLLTMLPAVRRRGGGPTRH